ncbi:hypothetical protein Mapa_013895 [Marchantia paleacea]|nr:hypothetical protein Mapa_013895 [Marchantia paleacea]
MNLVATVHVSNVERPCLRIVRWRPVVVAPRPTTTGVFAGLDMGKTRREQKIPMETAASTVIASQSCLAGIFCYLH